MANIGSKELLLSSVISGELESLGRKMDFWQVPHPEGQTLWESDKPLSLAEALTVIDPEGEDLANSRTLALLYGIGWEFIWGKKPPEIVSALREEVIVKARCGLEMNELEKLWYSLILVDTDMF